MLEIKNISKTYRIPRKLRDSSSSRQRGRTFFAVEDVSLMVSPGDVHGLVGGNGSGKSTILRIAAGLSSPTSGAIYIDGVRKHSTHKTGIGYLPSSGSLYPFMSARDNVKFYGKLAGLKGADLEREICQALESAGCNEYQHVMPEDLSFGMSQRVRMARLLITSPKVLLLDEPSSGVDVLGALQFQETLAKIAESQVPIVLVSHNAAEVESLCDSLTFLDKGRVAYQGSIPEFIRTNNSLSFGQAILNMSLN